LRGIDVGKHGRVTGQSVDRERYPLSVGPFGGRMM
jgi:hypothetical protein